MAGHGGEKDNILVNDYGHTHNHDHGYKHEHKPYHKHSAKQKQSKKHKHNKDNKEDDDFKQYLDNFKVNPEKHNDHDYFNVGPVFKKTGKSVHTEHYEVKKINPDAKYPDEKYIIKGSYKVQETDPFFDFTTTAVHAYDDQISKIAAKILTNYDYTNFDPHSGERESADFLDSREKEDERDGPEYASIEDYDGASYNKYGAKKEKTQDYNSKGKYDDNSAEKERGYGYNNVYPSHGNYQNNDAKKGKVDVYNTAYPSHGQYVDYDVNKKNVHDLNNAYPSKENINVYSHITPNQGKYNDNTKTEKTNKIQDHSVSFPTQAKKSDYNVKAEIFNDYSNVHPNPEKTVDYSAKKLETPNYNVYPSYGKIVVNEPNYNYADKKVDYFIHPNYEVESKSNAYDYHALPSYYGPKELDYFVNPNHGDYLYGSDWQDHIMRTVYGNDYASSNLFASKVLPDETEKSK